MFWEVLHDCQCQTDIISKQQVSTYGPFPGQGVPGGKLILILFFFPSLCHVCLLKIFKDFENPNPHQQHSITIKSVDSGPDRCGSVGRHYPAKQNVTSSDSQSRHIPGLRVQSLVGVYMRGNRSMFLTSMFFSFSLPSHFSKNKEIKPFLKSVDSGS